MNRKLDCFGILIHCIVCTLWGSAIVVSWQPWFTEEQNDLLLTLFDWGFFNLLFHLLFCILQLSEHKIVYMGCLWLLLNVMSIIVCGIIYHDVIALGAIELQIYCLVLFDIFVVVFYIGFVVGFYYVCTYSSGERVSLLRSIEVF